MVDVSGSTLASDVAPTRLQAVKQAAMGLLDQVPADLRVGLVSFSTEAETLVRPSTDRDLVRQRTAGLQPNGGTAIGAARRIPGWPSPPPSPGRAEHRRPGPSGAGPLPRPGC